MPDLIGHLDTRRVNIEIAAFVGLFQACERDRMAVDTDIACSDFAEQFGSLEFAGRLHDYGAIAQREELIFRQLYLHSQGVAHRHLDEGLGDSAVAQRPCRDYLSGLDALAEPAPIPLELFGIGHVIGRGGMAKEVYLIAGLLERGRNDIPHIDRGDAEGNEGRGDMDMFEGAAHRVFSADGRESEGCLHLQRAEKGAQRLTPGMGVLRHALEVLLVREAHPAPVCSRGRDLRTRLHHGISRAVVRAPEGEVGVEAEGHDAGGVGHTGDRNLLDRNLGLAGLTRAAVGHEHGRAADRGIKHLYEALLRGHVGRSHHCGHLLLQRAAFGLTDEGIAVFDGRDCGLRVVARSGAVDERAGKVAYLRTVEVHPHPARIGYVRHMGRTDIVRRTEFHEALLIGRFDHHRHSLLGLAYRELGLIEAGVFDGDTVQVYVESGSEFAYRYTDAARAEVVGFLYKFRHLRAAEEALELALLGGVALLDLGSAALERGFGMLFRRAGGAADSVAAGGTAQKQYYVARDGTFAAHLRGLYGANYGADFHALGSIAVGIDLPYVGGSETDLVSVAGITTRSLARNHSLRELPGNGFRDLGGNVARSGHAHRLIDVRAAGQRVADSAAEAGRRPAERFYFRRVVMSLVLEHEKPLLNLTVYIYVDVDAAGVVLFALLLVVEYALGLQPAGTDGRKLHKAKGLVSTAQFAAHIIK